MFSWTVLLMTLLKKRTYSLPNSLVPSQLLLIEYVIARTSSYCKGYLHKASPTSFGTRSRAAPSSALFLPPPCADSGLPPPLPPRRWPTAPAIFQVSVSSELAKRGIHAGKIAGAVGQRLGGKGGGRPESAQGGGKNKAELGAALDLVPKLVGEAL